VGATREREREREIGTTEEDYEAAENVVTISKEIGEYYLLNMKQMPEIHHSSRISCKRSQLLHPKLLKFTTELNHPIIGT
jgi:hypothetical protein